MFTIAMNDLPNIPDQANALEPRLNVIDFPNSYVGREDTTLKFRLQEEAAEGKLINFVLKGLVSLRQAKKFVMPTSSQRTIEQLRELTTPVIAFIRDCCEFPEKGDDQQDFIVPKDQVYEAWTAWCEEQGRKFKGLKEQFGRWFAISCPHIITVRVLVKNKRLYAYGGVRLADWVANEYLGRP